MGNQGESQANLEFESVWFHPLEWWSELQAVICTEGETLEVRSELKAINRFQGTDNREVYS